MALIGSAIMMDSVQGLSWISGRPLRGVLYFKQSLSFYLHKLGDVELGSAQDLDFPNENVLKGVDALACLLYLLACKVARLFSTWTRPLYQTTEWLFTVISYPSIAPINTRLQSQRIFTGLIFLSPSWPISTAYKPAYKHCHTTLCISLSDIAWLSQTSLYTAYL